MSSWNHKIFPQDLQNILLYGKLERLFINNLSKELSLNQELLVLDKNFVTKWKDLSGYNIFKKEIFYYLSFISSCKENQEKQKEAENKLLSLWQNAKNSKKFYPDKIKTLPKMNILINEKIYFTFIPFQLLSLFNDKINEIIKVNGVFNKGKLICTLNRNNYYFIYMLLIKNGKDLHNTLFTKLYFDLPYNNPKNSKVEKLLYDENLKSLKEKYNDIISGKTNIATININDEGINYQYRVFTDFKSYDNNDINTNNNNFQTEYETKLKELTLEKEKYNEENNNLIKEENLLNIEKKKLDQEKLGSNTNFNIYATFKPNNETMFISDIKKKISIAENEYKKKLDEFEKIKHKINNKKRYLIQEKRKQQKINKNSENQINNDNNEGKLLKKKENDLLIKEKALKEKKNLILNQQKLINDKENELNSQIFAIDQKLMYYKNKNFLISQNKNQKEIIDNEISDDELEKIQEEIDIENNNKKLEKTEKRLKYPFFIKGLIQCFAHLKEITTGFFELEQNKFFIRNKNTKLAKIYCDILHNILNNKKYQAENFIRIFNKMHNNSNDLSISNFIKIFILNLHNELNIKKNYVQNKNQLIEGTNQNEVLIQYLKNFTQNNNSLISKYFFALIKNKIICNSCNSTNFNYNQFYFLSFNLIDIKLKIKNKIHINDCFDYFQAKVDNINHLCPKCGSSENSLYRTLYSSQPILIIVFERGSEENLCRDEIQYDEELNLEKYIEYNRSGKKFFLCGVISIIFEGNNLKKDFTFYREGKGSKWYSYDDEKQNLCNVSEMYNKRIPIMLIYHRE